jgi:two-component system, NtrC family, response regulator HydG
MSRRIFIVDDDQDHAESLADILELRGYEVEVAFTGEDAIERFREADFDLVFMDVKLPGKNGVETFFAFRQLRPDARVMMMTGFSVEQLVRQAVEGGALGVLHKPFSGDDLLKAVEGAKPRGLVLVADDDVLYAESITTLLSEAGYRVRTARTGQEALDMMQGGGFDCLLLDLKMPVLSGLEVYLALRDQGRLVPTILITAHATGPEAKELCPLTQGLLAKPFDPGLLLEKMAALQKASAG